MTTQRFIKIFIVSLLFAAPVFAQNDAAQKAQVEVTIVDSKNKAREGELVIFDAAKSKQKITGHTNKAGKLSMQLPTGDDYAVSIQAVSETDQYSTLSIPTLQPGESLTGAYKVNIIYEPAKTYKLDNVQFDVSKATLRPSSFKELQELVDYMKWHKEEKIEIAGHTDSSGIEEKNVILSQERAEAIKTYLVKNGVPAANIVARGYGSAFPIADNLTPEGKAKNRRTEVRRIVE